MARPQRCRRVCREPQYAAFSPTQGGDAEPITLTTDEYEVIRLVDYEKRTHAACAALMDVSRSTVTEIYESARGKLADCLVNGRRLDIAGGNYRLCDGAARCGKPCGRGALGDGPAPISKGEHGMRIAVTYENGEVFQHFGHTEQFKLYDEDAGQIVRSEIVSTCGSGHGALADFLSAQGVDILLCGGIGGGAQEALRAAGIQFFGGVSGSADAAAQALLAGTLAFVPDVRCEHHEHGQSHACGAHGCGGHSCG